MADPVPASTRFLRFVGERESASAGTVTVRAPASGARYTLSAQEFALAQLFDGARAPAERHAAAAAIAPDLPAGLAPVAEALALAGLLAPGRDEPLPPPRQQESAAGGFPPSHMAGSLAGPGYSGGVAGLFGRMQADADPPRRVLRPGAWLWLGDALNVTLGPLRWLLLALVGAALFGLWQNRLDAARDAALLLAPARLALTAVLAAALLNWLSQLARAAAVRRWAQAEPLINLHLRFGVVPVLIADTAGAERADSAARLRIVASALNAPLLLFALLALSWLVLRGAGNFLPSILLGLACAAMIVFLLRLNPLARRDGYHWLAQRLGVPDLRDQALIALLGYQRPWARSAPLPAGALRLYGLATLAFALAVVALLIAFPGRWLEASWGGAGVAVFLAMLAFSLWQQSRPYRSARGAIADPAAGGLRPPSRRAALLAGLLGVLALLPYRYEPSGELVVLPRDRADVRALVRGDVREVLVREGEVVKAEQEIARLADHQERAQVSASTARLEELKADLALAQAGARSEEVEIARQRVTTARTRFEVADAEAKRLEAAHKRRAVTIQDYQRAQGAADVRRQELVEAERNLALVEGGTRPEQLQALEAQVAAAQAQLEYHREQLENTRIRAPIAGRVVSSTLLFARGAYLDVGAALAVVEDTAQLRAEVRVPESALADVAVGARASVKVWTRPGERFGGTVAQIAPNAEDGPYGKVVRVLVDLDSAAGVLVPEMTGQAKIEGGTYPAIVVFTRALARFVLVEVWSWLP